MSTINVYENCPIYETPSFKLRLVQNEDAPALLACYTDPRVSSRANSDHCTGDFSIKTLEKMEECILSWLREYKKQAYVRFSIIPKSTNNAVGTVEIWGGEWSVLRIDIATAYDLETYIEEILQLAVTCFVADFEIESMKIKVSNTPDRIPLLKKYGFVPDREFRPELGYYKLQNE